MVHPKCSGTPRHPPLTQFPIAYEPLRAAPPGKFRRRAFMVVCGRWCISIFGSFRNTVLVDFATFRDTVSADFRHISPHGASNFGALWRGVLAEL